MDHALHPRRQPVVSISRRARRGAEIRQRIFRSAIRLFAERGYVPTRVEDITEAADVAKGTFFNYFPSKEHLLIRFGEERTGLIRAALDRAVQSDSSIHTILGDLWREQSKEPGQSREMASSMMVTMLGSPEVKEQVCLYMRRNRGLLAKIIALGQNRGEIRRDRTSRDLAGEYQRIYFGAMLMWVLDRRESLAAWQDESFCVFWASVAAHGKVHKGRSS
ncbi:MAG: TetR/AcrR family transcriptional regulator [Candidatus Acidiferrales bacterium]